MDQTELIDDIAIKLDISKTLSQRLLRATLREIRTLLKDGQAITIPHWGTFDTVIHEARRGFLPLGFLPLGQGYAIFPKRRVPVFRTGKLLHDDVYDLDIIEEDVPA
jgi:nucleoid DNA-binding protein